MEIFTKSILSDRKSRAAKALDQVLKSGDAVFFYCGQPLQKPGGLDQTYPFLPHPDYFWLTGYRRPWGITCYSLSDGWTDFIKPISREESIWEGSAESLEGEDLSQFEEWLKNKNFQNIFSLGQVGESHLALVTPDFANTAIVQEKFNEVRRIKDSAEVQLIRKAGQTAARGYARLQDFIRPGVTERQIQIEFEAEVLRAGAEKFPYETIVGAGVNSAVLHAIPTLRVAQAGELVLIDGGADIHDYCVDITRVFPVDGHFSQRQKSIYDIVLAAQKEGIRLCNPGTAWIEVHRAAATIIADGLKGLNLLRGDTDNLLDSGAVSVFFPHGVGHMVGLKVRDVGGRFGSGPATSCGVRLRVDLDLEENFIMTVEPGIYFVPAIFNHPELRQKYPDQVNWAELEKWQTFGGIRLEDDILVSSKAPENLTGAIPK